MLACSENFLLQPRPICPDDNGRSRCYHAVHLPYSELFLQPADGERGGLRKKVAINSCPVSRKLIFFWEPLVSCVKWYHTHTHCRCVYLHADVVTPAACGASESKQAKKGDGSYWQQTKMKTLNVLKPWATNPVELLTAHCDPCNQSSLTPPRVCLSRCLWLLSPVFSPKGPRFLL